MMNVRNLREGSNLQFINTTLFEKWPPRKHYFSIFTNY